jgi:hypothetical protein
MELISFLLTLLTLSAGLFAGAIVALSAKEELRASKKYFFLLQDAVLLSFLAFIWTANLFDIGASIVISIIILLMLPHPDWVGSRVKPLARLRMSIVQFVLLALLLSAASLTAYFSLVAGLALLYCIATGTLAYMTYPRWTMHLLAKVITLVVFGYGFWYLQ